MSRFGNRLPRNFDVDGYLSKLHGQSRRGPIGPAPLPTPIVGTAVDLPDIFQAYCAANGLAMPVKEFIFHPTRKWRADYAFIANRLLIDIEGGLWSASEGAKAAHAKPLAILRDMEKSNAAQLLGWRFLRYTPTQFAKAVTDIKIMLAKEAA